MSKLLDTMILYNVYVCYKQKKNYGNGEEYEVQRMTVKNARYVKIDKKLVRIGYKNNEYENKEVRKNLEDIINLEVVSK